jgi:ferritin
MAYGRLDEMLNVKLQDAFNEQMKWELYSSYLYLSMASYFNEINLMGFARWMEVQALEELYHAMKFYNYVNERGGRVRVAPIDGPRVSWDSPLAAFTDAYNHETVVTGRINDLMELAIELKDHAAQAFSSVVRYRTGGRRSECG